MTTSYPIARLRKNPLQARSSWTVEVLLRAAAQVLEEDGEEAATTGVVARRAGVSIGTLYWYFEDRDAILLALASDEFRRLSDRITILIAKGPESTLSPG